MNTKHYNMKTKRSVFIIFAIFFLFIFTINISQARLGEFPQGTCVDIKTISNSSSINISSINYPNTTTAISNQVMTKVGQTFNFTFCDTQTLGVYTYDYFDAEGFGFVNDFLITPIGDSIDTGSSILYIIIIFAILILFIFFALIAINTPFDNIGEMTRDGFVITQVTKTKYVKLVATWISAGLFMWLITIVSGIANNYIKFDQLVSMTTNLYLFLNTAFYGISAGIIWLLFWYGWKDIILNKTILEEGKAILNSL